MFVHLGEEHREGNVCAMPKVNPSFQRWFKWSIPVMEYQSQIRTLASFFVRLFGVDDAIRFTIGQSEGGAEGANHEEEEKSHGVQKRKSVSKRKKRREEKSDSSLFESEKWTVCEIPSISGVGENLRIDLGNLQLCSFGCGGQLVTTRSPITKTSEMQLKREEQNGPLIRITKGAYSQATMPVLSFLSMCQWGNGGTERVGKNRRFPRKCPMSTCSSCLSDSVSGLKKNDHGGRESYQQRGSRGGRCWNPQFGSFSGTCRTDDLRHGGGCAAQGNRDDGAACEQERGCRKSVYGD